MGQEFNYGLVSVTMPSGESDMSVCRVPAKNIPRG